MNYTQALHTPTPRHTRAAVARLAVWAGVLNAAIFAFSLPSGVMGQEVLDLPAADRLLDPDLEEVYRVDPELPGLSAPLTTVAKLEFDENGNLYVYDRTLLPVAARVVVVAPDGSLVREFGKMGWERGEFRGPGSFALLPGGRSAVSDSEHSGYLIFGPTGDYERMVRFPRRAGGDMMSMMMAPGMMPGLQTMDGGRAGDFIYKTTNATVNMDLDEESFSVEISAEGPSGVIERVSLAGNRISTDTVVRAWRPSEGLSVRTAMSANPAAMTGDDPSSGFSLGDMELPWIFAPPFEYGVLPDGGLAYIDTVSYRVKITGPEGETLRVIRRPIEPEPVTEEFRAEMMVAYKNAAANAQEMLGDGPEAEAVELMGGMIDEMADEMMENLRFFPEIPVLAGLQITWGGGLWVARAGDPLDAFDGFGGAPSIGDLALGNIPGLPEIGSASGTSGLIDVISANGSYVGTFDSGALEPPGAFGPDGLAAWVESVDDQPVIVVRRLPAALRTP